MASRRLSAVAGILLATFLAAPAMAAGDLVLDKAVVLMRHGVRPPTSSKAIAPFAAKPWPTWEVADGMLTPHGAEAVGRLGAWEGRMLASRGLLNAPECPKPGEVFAWASSQLQRTVDTGNALLAAMFPGCGLAVGHGDAKGADPLFTASDTDLGRLDPEKGRAAILAAMDGSFDGPKQRLAPLYKELSGVLGCGAKGCDFADRPWDIVAKSDGRNLSLEGPIGEASTIAQVFLLEYANGLPPDQLAWGHITSADDVIRLSAMRQVKYEYFERVPYIARRGASNILNQLLIGLAEGASVPGVDTAGGPPDARLTLFVGSDTQIAEIGGMLDAHWTLDSYLKDETPPSGGLVFERLLDKATGQRFVRVEFLTPRLDQIRAAVVLDDANPPEFVQVSLPGCDGQRPDGACPIETFAKIVSAALDRTAVAPQTYH
ncbi:histidine-type phosphatase [Inquilinus limosus]|nr:histidine-type phosphatase [Inquilinus limosus]